ncbi:MAG: hypothetical protein R3F50_19265 [Gammaproteobacteria bacterium]
MLDKLRHPRARRAFIVIVLLATVVSLVVNYVVEYPAAAALLQSCPINSSSNPFWCEGLSFTYKLISQLTYSFISAALVAVLFIGIYAVVQDEEKSTTDVEIIFQPDQRKRHYHALGKATFWLHNGHLANWVRRHVLPEFHKRSAEDLASRKIHAAILDPCSDGVCETYLVHVAQLPVDQQRITDLLTLKADICATIYLFCKYYKEGLLDLSIYLKRELSFIRDDICDSCTFWTTAGKNTPAILLLNRDASSHYYNLSLKAFQTIASKHYQQLDISKGNTTLRSLNMDEKTGIGTILRLYFPNEEILHTQSFIDLVLERSKME